jgi:hypothetical protein
MQIDSFKTRVESADGFCAPRLKLDYHQLLSTVAFKFNLGRYNLVPPLRDLPR